MLFLADESCGFSVVGALRGAGHDVVAGAEISPRADDEDVLDLASRERRNSLTEDKGRSFNPDEVAFDPGMILLKKDKAQTLKTPPDAPAAAAGHPPSQTFNCTFSS